MVVAALVAGFASQCNKTLEKERVEAVEAALVAGFARRCNKTLETGRVEVADPTPADGEEAPNKIALFDRLQNV